jgi:hypothetical protein
MKRAIQSLLAVMMVITGGAAATVGTLIATASPAAASCSASSLDGNWHNINSSNPFLSRAVVETCQPVTTCNGNICTVQYDAGTFITPFGKCTPTDCNWGRKQVQYTSDGWIRAFYNFGFKTSDVWAKNYVYYGQTYLRVWIYNAYSDGHSYTSDEWFLR